MLDDPSRYGFPTQHIAYRSKCMIDTSSSMKSPRFSTVSTWTLVCPTMNNSHTFLTHPHTCHKQNSMLWWADQQSTLTFHWPFTPNARVRVCLRSSGLWNTITVQLLKKCTNKPVKRFQMKSNGCRDVQHTGLYKAHKQEGKQGAQTRGTRSAHIFPSIPTSVAAS